MAHLVKRAKASVEAEASRETSKATTLGIAEKGTVGLLDTFAGAIEEMRSLVACRICTRPMYEPYTTTCGHSYCYSCLVQWFSCHRRKKTCPGCRARIAQKPVPNYTIKNLVQVLISHPAFLEDGDSMEKLREDQKQEAILVESDRSGDPQNGRMLFKGYFDELPPTSIFDTSDGVYRCPFCNWELEGGRHCGQCDRIFENDNDSHAALSFSGDEDSIPEDTESEPDVYDPEDYAALAGELDNAVDIERMTSFADYSPGQDGTVYDPSDLDDDGSTATEELQMRQLARAAVGDAGRIRVGANRTDSSVVAWSDSDTESESEDYETPTHLLSMQYGPITWANHPNFARTNPNNESEDEYDPDIDDFIDDESLGIGSVGTASTDEGNVADDDANEEDDEDEVGDRLSPISENSSSIVAQALDRREGQDAEPSDRSSISSQDTSTLTDQAVKEEDEQSIPSSESVKYMPQQQSRKRRRLVVMDDSDEIDEMHKICEARATRLALARARVCASLYPRMNTAGTIIRSEVPLHPGAALLPLNEICTPTRSLPSRQRLAVSSSLSTPPSIFYPPSLFSKS